MEENKEFYLIVKGEKVIVSEEVYRAYVRPVRKDERRKRRNMRCKIVGKKGNLVRCQNDCSDCAYAKNGKPNGKTLSFDEFKDKGYEIENRELNVEADYIETEEKNEQKNKLYKAIKQLSPRQKEIVRLIYFEEKTQDEVANELNISQGTVSTTLDRAVANLRKIIGK